MNVLVNNESLTDIADAIRGKLGVTTTYKPDEMADAIESIPPVPLTIPYWGYAFVYYRGTQLDLADLDTSKVTTMSYMFNACTNLTSLDLSNFDTSNVTNMVNMFSYCNALTTLIIGSETDTAPQPLKADNLFNSCPSTMKIYVPDNLVSAYKSATYWSTYASRIVGWSELPS